MSDNNPDQDDFDASFEDGGADLGYEEESFADEEFGDDSWDENFEDDGAEPADDHSAPPAKKKSGLFNVILIAAAVLGGGAFIYLKVLAPSTRTVPQPTPMAAASESSPEMSPELSWETQQAALPVETPASPPTPEQATPEQLMPEQVTPELSAASDGLLPVLAPDPALAVARPPADAVPDPAAALTDAPVAPITPAPQQPVEVASAPPMPAPPMPAPIVMESSPATAPEAAIKADNGFNPGLPSAKDIMLSADQGVPAPAPAAVPAPAPEVADAAAAPPGGLSADAAKGIEQKLSVLLARLDTFEGRIANLESGLHQVSSKTAALETKPAAAADLDGVNNALQALERKISGLEKASATASAIASERVTDVSKIDKPTFVPAAPEPAAEPAPAPKTASTANIPKPVVKTEPATTAARSVAWVLRSAQPGAAMVVPKSGGDMRTVRVGDNLSGLGRIIAIEQRGSRWVVQGTQGTLTH